MGQALRRWFVQGPAVLMAFLAGCGSASDDVFRTPSTSDGGSTAETPDADPPRGGSNAIPADASSGGGTNVTVPTNCDSDNDCTPFGLLCDLATARCAECLGDVDCGSDEACQGGTCIPVIRCTDSLDCVDAPDRLSICDGASGRCVECVLDADCLAGTCRDSVCAVDCVPASCSGSCGIIPDGCGATIDCGPCAGPCSDGMQNGGETDVDCGGGCVPCADGRSCNVATDCQSRVCQGTCQAPTCVDGVLNGNETATDCGGSCPACSVCGSGLKRCGGLCVAPAPDRGCALDGCVPCSTPANASAVCNGSACDFTCDAGFERVGSACEPVGDGGSCDPAGCPSCTPTYVPCCTAAGACGCKDSLGLLTCQ